MKYRNGFVSNSSSSSYIVVGTGSITCEHCGLDQFSFLYLLSELHNYDFETTRIVRDGKESVLEWLNETVDMELLERVEKGEIREEELDYYDRRDLREHRELVAAVKAVDVSTEVAKIEISYHDRTIQSLFRMAQKMGNVKVLYSDH